MKNKLALFDLDGTLFDTKEANYYAYKKALNEFGYDLDYKYFCDECYGKVYKEFLLSITDGMEETLKTIHNRKKELYYTYFSKVKMNKHLFEIAKNIGSEYYLVVATTSSKKNAYEILRYFNKEDMFDLILTNEDITYSKPNPEIFLKAMEYFKISPDNTIIFEDSKVGIEAARKSGANVFIIDSFTD